MLEQFKTWWEETSEREQKLVLIAGGVFFLVLIYYLLWQPIASDLEAAEEKLTNTQQTLQWVEKNVNDLLAAGITQQTKLGKKQSLSQLINSTARRNSIDISRVQNDKERVDVWINEIEFTQFIKWITALKNDYAVNVVSVDINKTQREGAVKVNRLSLSY